MAIKNWVRSHCRAGEWLYQILLGKFTLLPYDVQSIRKIKVNKHRSRYLLSISDSESMLLGEAGAAVYRKVFEDHKIYLLSSLMIERDCTTIKLKMPELGQGEGDNLEQKERKLRDIQNKLKGRTLSHTSISEWWFWIQFMTKFSMSGFSV